MTVYNVGFQKCPPGYGWGPGVRDHYLLHYIVSGRGTYETGGRTFVLGPGDAFWPGRTRPSTTAPTARTPGNTTGWALPVPARRCCWPRRPLPPHVRSCVRAAGDKLRQALLDIYKSPQRDYPAAVRMAGYLQAALGLLMAEGPRRGEEALSRYARQGAQFLQRNYRRNVGVEETARTCGVSRSCLHTGFSAEFCCAPERLPHPVPHSAGLPAAAPQQPVR
ncbi:MAG: AraC family ligand binding domain-containing protein [Dysosmobacter sp.]